MARLKPVIGILFAVMTMGLSPPDFDRSDIVEGVPTIIDGDTIELSGQRIVLYGIDAPELEQSCRIYSLDWPCGARALVWLRRFIGNGIVRCLPKDGNAPDDRKRHLKAMCFNHANINLSAAMVGEGMAFANLADGPWFKVANFTARTTRKGLWASEFVPPADWRKGRRLGVLRSGNRKKLKP